VEVLVEVLVHSSGDSCDPGKEDDGPTPCRRRRGGGGGVRQTVAILLLLLVSVLCAVALSL
jgi:hypothetical protein